MGKKGDSSVCAGQRSNPSEDVVGCLFVGPIRGGVVHSGDLSRDEWRVVDGGDVIVLLQTKSSQEDFSRAIGCWLQRYANELDQELLHIQY